MCIPRFQIFYFSIYIFFSSTIQIAETCVPVFISDVENPKAPHCPIVRSMEELFFFFNVSLLAANRGLSPWHSSEGSWGKSLLRETGLVLVFLAVPAFSRTTRQTSTPQESMPDLLNQDFGSVLNSFFFFFFFLVTALVVSRTGLQWQVSLQFLIYYYFLFILHLKQLGQSCLHGLKSF